MVGGWAGGLWDADNIMETVLSNPGGVRESGIVGDCEIPSDEVPVGQVIGSVEIVISVFTN